MGLLKNLFGSSKSDAATSACGKCGTDVITNAERLQGMQRIAKEYGGSPDENGQVVVPRGISSFTGPNSLQKMAARAAQTEEIQRNLQRDLNENASRCGFRCTQCGKIFCLTCLGRDAKTHPVYGGKACFACGGNVRAIDDPIVQAEYYIVSILPPEPANREVLISRILAANGYSKGTAGVYLAVSASGPESLDAFTMGLMFNYEQRTGKELDNARTKIHKFGTDAIQGKMIAVFHTGKPYFEAFDLPLGPRGSKDRLNYEFLCLQEDIDFAVIDRSDRILLNKRISIPAAMQQTNRQILKLLIQAPDGPDVSDAELHNALTEHKYRVPLSAIRYSSDKPAGSDPRKTAEGSHGKERATPTMTDHPMEKESVGSSTSFTATQADLIVELVTLVKQDNSGFANRPRIREIGQELNRQGGMKLMQQAYYKVRATGAYFSQDIWHEIGEWEQ